MKKYILPIVFISVLLLSFTACDNIASKKPFEPYHEHQYRDLSIHFLELGNKFTGDCVYIKYGDVDILIDAGSKQESSSTIRAYIDQYVEDGKLEYVIATHAHEDHISGFNTYNSGTGIITGILDAYEIGTIIDFPMTNSSSATYNHYQEARTRAIQRGAFHFTALECYLEENGAKRVYNLDEYGDAKLEILYNYYYDHPSSNENNYSVCVKIIQGEHQYIFTGDLEKDGEDRLTAHYITSGGLGHCALYKGGHHGSNTSSNEALMAAISPEYVCVCTCCGTTEYTTTQGGIFPTQNFINRVAPYTDSVYVTTLVTDFDHNLYESLNGDIVFSVSEGAFTVTCSNNNLKLKDTEWFKLNRTLPDAWK